ncbi:MAG: alpha-glucuronidase family glycosyl hydrolase [Balneolales bacterium]
MVIILLFIVMLMQLFSKTAIADQIPKAEDLWLKYDKITDESKKNDYELALGEIHVNGNSKMMKAVRDELELGINGLLGRTEDSQVGNADIIVGTHKSSDIIRDLKLENELKKLGNEGFIIRETDYNGKPVIVIASKSEVGVLYGAFRFLRELQTYTSIYQLNVIESPKIEYRMLNHWDNIVPTQYGTVERGYSGRTLWIWDELPGRRRDHYRDYARAMASVGLNSVVLNNVNSEPKILTTEYLDKVAGLADEFRPYGIRVFLSASFAAPLPPADRPRFKRWGGIGDLDTADPLDPQVQKWWQNKADEIYNLIPDFGGFLVKADSEGTFGPNAYDRSHAEGANLLADALAPHRGIVIWRAFVYDSDIYDDRVKAAYGEFKPLDGEFRDNVVVQVKNGPLDFQPREPVHPLFGAMPNTPLSMEFQITQEYLGHNIHLVYLGPMWEKILNFDTYYDGKGTTVARIIDGSVHNYDHTVIAGVSNVGIGPRPVNWTGHPFGQANWYAFGRFAWNPNLDSEKIAREWIRMTWPSDSIVEETIVDIMMGSWQAAVNYKAPLGLNFTVEGGPHYDPAPAKRDGNYWFINEKGIGFDRTSEGSNAISQYHTVISDKFNHIHSVPEDYLLWFHFVPWSHEMESGRLLWDELVYRYNSGVEYVNSMLSNWEKLESHIEPTKFRHVQWLLTEQLDHAGYYRDVSINYFSEQSGFSYKQ